MTKISAGVVHDVPPDLKKALSADKVALERWESLTPLACNEWICWVESVKKPETRILQGASSTSDFEKLAEYFSSLRIFKPFDDIKTYEKAAKLYFMCRQEGITIRSTIGCLIAQIAIEQKLTLLHSDKDYDRIATLTPLKLAN